MATNPPRRKGRKNYFAPRVRSADEIPFYSAKLEANNPLSTHRKRECYGAEQAHAVVHRWQEQGDGGAAQAGGEPAGGEPGGARLHVVDRRPRHPRLAVVC